MKKQTLIPHTDSYLSVDHFLFVPFNNIIKQTKALMSLRPRHEKPYCFKILIFEAA